MASERRLYAEHSAQSEFEKLDRGALHIGAFGRVRAQKWLLNATGVWCSY